MSNIINPIYLKYYFKDALYNTVGMFVLYAVIRLFSSSFNLKEVAFFALMWGIFYPLFNLIYYTIHLRKLGLRDLDEKKLSKELELEKSSHSDFKELVQKLNKYLDLKECTLEVQKDRLIVKSKNKYLSWGDPISIIFLTDECGKCQYMIRALQKDLTSLASYYKNFKNLNFLKNLI